MTRAEQVALWDAVNEYAAACGGDTSDRTISDRRMNAVVAVECAANAERDKLQAFKDWAMEQLRTIHLRAGYILGACRGEEEMKLEAKEIQRLINAARAALAGAPPAPEEGR